MTNNKSQNERLHLNRRELLKAGLVASLLCAFPWPAWARYSLDKQNVRSLSLLNTHTGETLRKVPYWENGAYLKDALSEINYLLRDHRADAVKPIDPNLIDLLFAIKKRFDCNCPIEIISGYRSPETNKMLQKSSSGVAKKSYHMQGKAIDMRIPDVPLKHLQKEALNLQRGGVGYYPKSGFLHVDTGPVRSW